MRKQNGKVVGYKFYWANFASYPTFDNPDDIPVIELPVRRAYSSIEEILTSFAEAICLYFFWLMNTNPDETAPDPQEVEEVLQAYIRESST